MATIAIGVSKDPSGNYVARLPISSLMEGDVPPEEGDTVQFSVEGTITQADDQTATVKIDSVNGEPVSEEAAESPEEEGAENTGAGGPPGGGESTSAMGARLRGGAGAGGLGLM